MENTLVVKNMDGKDIRINVIDIIEDREQGKQYICYSMDNIDSIFISHLVKTEEGYSLETVSKEEKSNIEEVINQDAEGE